MNLLPDTHVAIWALVSPEIMPSDICALIEDERNMVYVSSASVWEIAIKHSLGKGDVPPFSAGEAVRYFKEAGFEILPIRTEHVVMVETLPLIHSDPFDRILIAQALSEPLRLLSHDSKVVRPMAASFWLSKGRESFGEGIRIVRRQSLFRK